MPDPEPGHAAHDPRLIAAHAAGDAAGDELARAAALMASCPECTRLHRDLRALGPALASAPAPARPRDFRLTAPQAETLRRPSRWRRLLAPLAGAGSAAGPLAASLAVLGLAGLLVGGGVHVPLGAGTAAPERAAPTAADASDPLTAVAGGRSVNAEAPSGAGFSGPSRPSPTALAVPATPSAGLHDLSTPAPPVRPSTPAATIGRAEAIAIARAARPDYAKERVLDTRLGTFAELGNGYANFEGPTPSPHDDVWLVSLGWRLGPLDGQGVFVVIDAGDGHVIQVVNWIS